MRKAVAMIRPFELRQNFYVYEDGNVIAHEHPKMDEINETITSFMHDYGINHLDLVGPKQYNRGLSKKIKEAVSTKYSNNELEINVL